MQNKKRNKYTTFRELLTLEHGQAKGKLLKVTEQECPERWRLMVAREWSTPNTSGPSTPSSAADPLQGRVWETAPGPAVWPFVSWESSFSTVDVESRMQKIEKYMGGDEPQAVPLAQPFKELSKEVTCSDSVGLRKVQAERVIWKQQTRGEKERDRLKLGGECGLALKSVRVLLQMEWKKGWGNWGENVIGRDKSWVSSPQGVCIFFFFLQSNRRRWEEIHRQVTQAPESLGLQDYWDRGNIWKNDRSLSSKQCKLTHLPGCVSRQEINLLKWKVVAQKRRGEWNETKENLTVFEGGIFRHHTEWFTEQLVRGNLSVLSDGKQPGFG